MTRPVTTTTTRDELHGARVLVFQHLAIETPGSVGDHLAEGGVEQSVVELDQGEAIPPLADYDALVVMGGPMDVWQEDLHPWLATEKEAIRYWVTELRRPFLGVCLGHQLLADSLGGEVGLMPEPEIGVMEVTVTDDGRSDPLLSGLAPSFRALQWHGAQVVRPPTGGVVLAGNRHCAIQAMRVGASAWGVQFHIEASPSVVAEWNDVPEYRSALAATGRGEPGWMHRAMLANQEVMASASGRLSGALLAQLSAGIAEATELAR
jgi:GMP synthase-like glutamine amidotransferase